MQTLSLSVRHLAEFAYPAPDISRTGDVRALRDGTLGHRARQAALGEGWQAEVALKEELFVPDLDLCLLLSGRMDAFRDDEDLPTVEEIKLSSAPLPPCAPIDAHRAQALGYAWLLLHAREKLARVQIQVVYVTRTGTVRARFPEILERDGCEAEFRTMLDTYVDQLRMTLRHDAQRDACLVSLKFPFLAYRPGQRAYAVQVYTAIQRRRRLFASMPTGTGKSAATLFPALKALGRGEARQLFYLTARTTQRAGPLDAISRMRGQLTSFWCLVLDAKEKQCPEAMICHPDICPRAAGHFLRSREALWQMLSVPWWDPEMISRVTEAHHLCPFEFALSLCSFADLVICDYNYALSPSVRLGCIFDATRDVTLLIDEAHNLLPRVRDMLSGRLDAKMLKAARKAVREQKGRNHPCYAALSDLIRELALLPGLAAEAGEGTRIPFLPASFLEAAARALDALVNLSSEGMVWGETASDIQDLYSDLLDLQRIGPKAPEDFAFLLARKTDPLLTARCLNPSAHFAAVTDGLQGTVCFSATMEPLEEMKRLMGGEAEDACFSAPSPFPPEHLLVLHAPLNVRYAARERSMPAICALIREMVEGRKGKYIVFFPSFAFLRLAASALEGQLVFQAQRNDMTQAEREAFLLPYREGVEPVLSLCVLGGLFAEGIDLPGRCLDGVMIVGVGLPQVGPEQEALKTWYEEHMGQGFLYAYQIPGMQKVAQAAGRVIRTSQDRGIVILVDDRFGQYAYRRLAPRDWQLQHGRLPQLLSAFWKEQENEPS